MPDIGSVAIIGGIAQSFLWWVFIIVLVLGLAIGPRYIRSRERQKLYDLMRAAVDRGQPLPPELVATLTAQTESPIGRGGADADLRRAIVLIAVGGGLASLGALMGWGISFASEVGGAVTGAVIAGAGAIPAFIGIAFLILWAVGRRHNPPHP